ncbi:MAG: GGDEF domain-containing response regulator [Planctomycetota bacterium]|jgi:diguanylate cyclase (GGDEF)-like protein
MSIRVLVVDDSATVRYKVCEVLQQAGMDVEQARSGREALEQLGDSHSIDVIITDLMMPGLVDGEKLIECLQKRSQLAMLPVIVLTALNEKDVHVRNLEKGASAFFGKPWDDDLLIATVRRLAQIKTREATFANDSRTDVLTGLFNRRYGAERLDELMSQCRRYGRLLSVVLLDIDHFKRVNDTLGHAAGDEVLRHVTRELRSASRASDIVVRWGGEEFLFIFPETDLSQAATIVDRFRARLAEAPILLNVAKTSMPLTISGGIAELEEHDTRETFVERADQALYRAKETGRNRLIASQLGELVPICAA